MFTHLVVFKTHQLQHVVKLQLQHIASTNYDVTTAAPVAMLMCDVAVTLGILHT
jgi:hypothetical protein